MNFAWRRFADVCDAHHQHLDICAPYSSGKWCHSCPGCEHPLYILHTHPDGLPLPPLHVARQGPFARCFDRWSRPRTDMLFVGDSQTKMLMFDLPSTKQMFDEVPRGRSERSGAHSGTQP